MIYPRLKSEIFYSFIPLFFYFYIIFNGLLYVLCLSYFDLCTFKILLSYPLLLKNNNFNPYLQNCKINYTYQNEHNSAVINKYFQLRDREFEILAHML